MKTLRLLLLVLLSHAYLAGIAQNQITTNTKQNFDRSWKFLLGDDSNAGTPGFNDAGWRMLDLPHDWSIEGKTDANNPSGNDGGYFPTGTGWYRKTFKLPQSLQQKKVGVYFEGVYMNADVYINGKLLGTHPYGYTTFYYDLSPYLNFGKENTIAVRVDNSKQKNSRWYSGSGIYRHVWLTVTNPTHIDQWGTTITTPKVSATEAVVQVKTVVKNETSTPQNITLTSMIEKGTLKAGSNSIKVEVPANSSTEVAQSITVKSPKLWSTTTPHLYTATTTINKSGKPIDSRTSTFGIRTLEFSTDKGFLLNGKQVILNGGCAHHDNGFLGAAAYDRAEEKKVELLKAGGFNAVRTSHNPPSEAFLDACDRLGMLVIDESFDGWRESKTKYDYASIFDEWWQRDVEAMVKRDRNHPSIFMWSTGNEIIERKKPEAVETAKKLTGLVHRLDPTRPVTSAITTWDRDWAVLDPLFAAHDIGGYNYQLHRAAADHVRVPERIIMQTESYPKDAFTNWKLVTANKYIIGDFVWTAIDYLGESSIGRYFYPGEPAGQHYEKPLFPWHGAYCGDIDLTGWRKPISHYRDMLYNDKKDLYLAVKEPNPAEGPIKLTSWAVWPTWESWTWPGFEGKDVQVEVYSKYPKIRLYLNNKLLGEQATGLAQEYKATFTVPYTAGVLKAVAVEDNKEVKSMTLKTAGEAASIKLTADRNKIKANGQDLSYITVEITDKSGIPQPNAENELSFKIKGPGVIAAVGNANLKDTNPYLATTNKAWKGRATVIVKSGHRAGPITIEVSSGGLQKGTVVVNAL